MTDPHAGRTRTTIILALASRQPRRTGRRH